MSTPPDAAPVKSPARLGGAVCVEAERVPGGGSTMRIDCPDEPTPLDGGAVVVDEFVPVKRAGVDEGDPGVETAEALFGVKPPGGV